MNNSNFYHNNNSKEKNNVKGQQFFPGGIPQPPNFPGTPPQQPGFPGVGEAPRSAPPSFTPEAPRMDQRRGESGEPSQFGGQRGGDFRTQPREFRRCINRFTFIWLINGNSFWFYPTFVSRDFVQGFRWRRNRWEFDRINLRRILFFRCF